MGYVHVCKFGINAGVHLRDTYMSAIRDKYRITLMG
jgi:hypothetical protein